MGLIGKTIGRYRVTAELGRGGMATVYRAHDPQLGRDVAIKVMHGAFAGRDDLEARFRREARAVAAIKHDGIVNVFDFAPAAAGEPGYIVTEIVEGPTLRAVIDRHGGRLLPEVAALVGARIAGALGAAHARGIVHRDVKPDNVMFDLASPGTARVLLTDFGIAHMTESETMTATGAIVGSPSYMSPEQARGQEIGPASDVFSLGVMLYYVATGRPPFAGRDPMTAIAAIQRGEFLRPSQVDAHVGPALEAVIVRCLQKLPAARFSDGCAVEAALGEIARDVQKMMMMSEGEARTGAGGGGGAGAVLRRFFDDAGTFGDVLRPRVAAQAFEQARRHVRRRELARALAEINRVFAYAPAHAGARALLAGIARRRRVGRGVAAGLLLAAVALGGVGVQRWRAAARRGGAAPVAGPVAVAGATAPEPGRRQGEGQAQAPIASAAGTPIGSGTGTAGSSAMAESAARHRPTTPKPHPVSVAGTSRTRQTGAATVPPPAGAGAIAVEGPPPAMAGEPSGAAAPARTTAATASAASGPAGAPLRPPASASLTLRASQGFCSPSMDDQPPSIHPSYDHVVAGPHRLYCTLPSGLKMFVADYDLRAGARPNLVIVPGADGKPALSRPE